jgi:hypothetical protein
MFTKGSEWAMKLKYNFLVAFSLVSVILILAACSSNQPSEGNSNASNAGDKSKSATTVKLYNDKAGWADNLTKWGK